MIKYLNITTTYSMQKAKEALDNIAIKNGIFVSVAVAHPDEPDAPINSLKELEDASNHLFVITKKKRQ